VVSVAVPAEAHRLTYRGDIDGLRAPAVLAFGAGDTMANVVKITTYVTDMRYRADWGLIREEYFGKKGCASTLVEIAALAHPDWMIEIEAIAVL